MLIVLSGWVVKGLRQEHIDNLRAVGQLRNVILAQRSFGIDCKELPVSSGFKINTPRERLASQFGSEVGVQFLFDLCTGFWGDVDAAPSFCGFRTGWPCILEIDIHA